MPEPGFKHPPGRGQEGSRQLKLFAVKSQRRPVSLDDFERIFCSQPEEPFPIPKFFRPGKLPSPLNLLTFLSDPWLVAFDDVIDSPSAQAVGNSDRQLPLPVNFKTDRPPP